MTKRQRGFLLGTRQSLSRRFFLLIVLCSFAALLVSAGLSLWLSYRGGLQRIENNLRLIQESYLPVLETSLYAVDEAQINLLLEGMLNLEGITHCEVRESIEPGALHITMGETPRKGSVGRGFDLSYTNAAGKAVKIGTLTVFTDASQIHGPLWHQTVVQVGTYAVMIFLSALLIMALFQRLVARHLFQMARFARSINLMHLDAQFRLRRRPAQDELEEVVGALNTMQAQLQKEMAEQKEMQEALRSERDLTRQVIETSPAGIVRLDAQGRLLYANQRAEEIMGLAFSGEEDRTYNDPRWKICNIDGGPFPDNRLPFAMVRQSGEAVFNIRHAIERPDGEQVLLSVNASPLRDATGVFEGMVATLEDITERLRLEDQLQQAQKMEAIGSLASGVAHDFNNLLAPVVGLADLLLEDLPEGSMEHENAGEILKAGLRGRDLVQQILAFSRQTQTQMMPVRLQNILGEVLRLCRATIPANIDIRHDIQKDCGLVMADAGQMHQVAMNLITNALHAVEANNGKISVTLQEQQIRPGQSPEGSLPPGRYAVFTVSDTGCGMEASVVAKIFNPYFTTKAQGKGTGLGLAVVYGIVKKHNGEITVRSELGKGSTFKVYLPLMARPAEHAEEARTPDDPTGDERILLVDDEPSIAKLHKLMLERLGYRVTAHIEGVEALKAFRDNPHHFDLVLSDMSMPQMTGDELAKSVMAVRPDIPVIVCTGFSERLTPQTAAQSGIKGVIMKPIVKAELARMVRKVLDEADLK